MTDTSQKEDCVR